MISLRNLTRCFVHVLVVIVLFLLPVDLYGQVISFNTDLVSLINKKRNGFEFQKEGYTSKLISEERYFNIKTKLNYLKQKLSKEKKSKTEYKIGDEREFFVRNILKGNTWKTSTGVLGFKSSLVNIWIQESAYDTLFGTQAFQEIIESFEQNLYSSTSQYSVDPAKGVLEILNQYAGAFPDVDGDGVLDVFLLDIQDNFSETGSFVAGFFDPVNLYDFEFSNQSDLIYLDIYPTIIYDGEINIERALSTFAHESQHLIHAGYEGDETELVFINEGFSEVIEILCGFEPRSEEGYRNHPLRGLLEWNYENPIPDYSRASLWTHYLAEQFGAGSIKKFIQNPETGLEGYENVFEPEFNISFKEVFRDWGIALNLNDRNISPEFGYEHPERKEIQLSPISAISEFPEAFKGDISGPTHIPLSFPLSREISIQTGNANSEAWISAISSYPGSEIQNLTVENMSSISVQASQFNHGFIQSVISYFGSDVMKSESTSIFSFLAEGEKSGRTLIQGYGDSNPDQFYLNASYLALNGEEQKMGVVFSPNETGFWLKEVLLRTVFRSELEGSGIDGDELRDFELGIYTFQNGKPDKTIISETIFTSQREVGKLVEETFALDSLYDSLSELRDSIIVVIGNDNDDQNYISIGMDAGTENASYFSEDASGNWVSLAEKSIGGNSLSGWNAIIRINTVVPEATKRSENIIAGIYNNFDQVFVELEPAYPFDSASVRVVAELPDGSFQKGKFIDNDASEYTFSFPVLANGEYQFQAMYKSEDRVTAFIDEQHWEIEIPDGFELGKNYPNPFNPETSVPFILLEDATIGWQVFDVIGRKVMEIPSQDFVAGEHSVRIQMDGLASGMYLARAKLTRSRNGLTTYRTQKIMLIK